MKSGTEIKGYNEDGRRAVRLTRQDSERTAPATHIGITSATLRSRERRLPVLIIRPFNAETFFGIALIGHPRTGRYYFPLGKVNDREAVANLSQVRLFDTKRLIRKLDTLDERTFRELAKALALTLFPFLLLK